MNSLLMGLDERHLNPSLIPFNSSLLVANCVKWYFFPSCDISDTLSSLLGRALQVTKSFLFKASFFKNKESVMIES